ncbi:MAG: sulfatase [Acidimicrobiales bacterium]
MADRSQPNVLFIITDQQRADHAGYMGNPVVRTPHLDGLAARGTVFDNAWVNNPVCMPNRSTIVTGRMPTAHGVVFNDRSLEWGANTHIRTFRDAGYRTALIGKSHLQHGMSRNSVVPVEHGPAVDDPYPPGWDTLENFERYLDGTAPEIDGSFYGFDTVELAIDHGSRISGHHYLWAQERGAPAEWLMAPMSDEAPGSDRYKGWWQIYRAPYDPELHSSSYVADRTSAFIEESASAGRPWLAWASFPDPHHPMCPPGDWFDRHDPADMVVPSTVDDPLVDAPGYVQRFASIHPSTQRMWVQPCGVAGDHDLVRHALAATYGMVELIDDRIGRILATVDAVGATDNTIVVVTADHGDMMGDHGLMLKGYMHYRGTLQIPLVVVDPTRGPGRTGSLAASIDIGPTLLGLVGLPTYDGIQGVSLAPVLDDRSASVRDHVLVEDDAPAAIPGPIPKKNRTVIDASGLKYTRHSTGEDQLFDLAADPDERVQLAPRDGTRRALMMERLADALMEADDTARHTPIAAG